MDYSDKIARYQEIERRGLLDKLPAEKQELWAEYKRRQQPEEKDYTLGRVAAFDSGATFGFGKKTRGLINAVGSKIADTGYRAGEVVANIKNKGLKGAFDDMEQLPSFADRYRESVANETQALEEYRQDKPLEAMGVELAGALVNPANKVGAGLIGKGANATSKALRSIGVGGATGGVAALGNTENLDDLAGNVASGTGIGTAVGAAIPLAGAAVRGGGNVLKQVLGKTTGAGDVAIADAFRAGQVGDKSFIGKMKGAIDAEGLEKKIQANFDKIKKARNMTYEDDITRLKQATMDKKLDLNPVINDVKTIIKNEGGGAGYLVDDDTARVLAKTKDTLNNFYKDKGRHNLEGFDNLKKALQNINTKEGTNAERVKTQITNSVKGQILKQSPEYKAINDAYSKDTAVIDDLKKVFSLNRNANSETVLKKVQSTARNNANTDWSYRAQLLKRLDPTGEIQQEISANALSAPLYRGLGIGSFAAGGAGMHFAGLPGVALGALAASPRAVGYGAYGLGKLSTKLPKDVSKITPYIAELLNNGAE